MVWGLIFFLSQPSLSKCQPQANGPPTHSSSAPSTVVPHSHTHTSPSRASPFGWGRDTGPQAPLGCRACLPHLNHCLATSFPLLASGFPGKVLNQRFHWSVLWARPPGIRHCSRRHLGPVDSKGQVIALVCCLPPGL